MKASDYINRVIERAEVQAIWKSPQARPANIRQHHRKLERVSEYALHLLVKLGTEARPQTWRFSFVPVLRFDSFQPRGWHENKRRRHGARRASSAFNCSQLTAPARSRSKLSKRRLSSAACAGVGVISASLKLSHSALIRASRSGGLRRVISSWVRMLMSRQYAEAQDGFNRATACLAMYP